MRRTQRRTRSARYGVATVELAIVLPVLIALVFGAIEICQRLHVKQSALIAAYEACRVATRPISDTDDVQTHAETLLTQQNVHQATVKIRNMTQAQNDLDNIVTGDEIRIRIDVPWGDNTISHYVIGDSAGSFRVEAYMLRE
ncbi:MAG: pilus assembly protein [Planctomycetales bacterium]|nr:pilus assembly protein [Planctomycetales bacterium]